MPPVLVRPLSIEEQRSLDFAATVMKVLIAAETHDAIGIACSYLLHCVYNEPETLRRVLNEPVVREGFRGESLIKTISRVARS